MANIPVQFKKCVENAGGYMEIWSQLHKTLLKSLSLAVISSISIKNQMIYKHFKTGIDLSFSLKKMVSLYSDNMYVCAQLTMQTHEL
jgi:hypothetical protein